MSNTKKVVLIVSAVLLVCVLGVGIVLAANPQGDGSWGFWDLFGGTRKEINESAALSLDG